MPARTTVVLFLLALFSLTPIVSYAQLFPEDPQAHAHRDQGISFGHQENWEKAIKQFQAAYELDRRSYLSDAAEDLFDMGIAYNHLRQYDKAIVCFQKGLPEFQQIKDNSSQASTLTNLGNDCYHLHSYLKAIGFYQKALLIAQKFQDRDGEAGRLTDIGDSYRHLSQYSNAIQYYQRALMVPQHVKDRDGQADILLNMGTSAQYLSQFDKAILYHQQALTLYQQVHDSKGEASDLTNLGNVYDDLSQYPEAIEYYHQALTIYQQLKDTKGEAKDIQDLGSTYFRINQYDEAIQYERQALTLHKQIKDAGEEAHDLNTLGNTYDVLRQYDKAIRYEQQALALHKQVKNLDGQALVLMDFGAICDDLGQYDKSIQYDQQALPIYRQVKDRDGEAMDLNNLGNVYNDLSQYPKAIQYLQQALPIYQQVEDRDGEAMDLGSLMSVWQKRKQTSLAIFYGKQSINVYQRIRQNIQTMDRNIQKTYIEDKEPTYRELAELLIQQGRLPEAEQVLGLLKDEELKDFVQRDATQLPATQRTLTYDPAEQTQKEAYATLAENVTAIGEQIEEILRKNPRTLDDAKQLTALQDKLAPAQAKFQAFLTALPKELPEPTHDEHETDQMLTDTGDQSQFRHTLLDLGPGTVAIFTIVEPDKVRLVLMTSQTQVAREYPIKDNDLHQKIEDFRTALKEPDVDPRPYGHALYQILIGPIEKDLDGAKATTLMWSLDADLRYIPMAALYDGKQYLVERYRNTEFTGANLFRMDATPPAQYTVLGLGVSQAHPGYPALPGVPQELNGIVKDTQNPNGVLDGAVLLDSQLAWEALKTDLNLGYPLVHIASHFALGPDFAHSFLLLGDGPHSLDEISSLPQIFQSVSLLTLSACETAVGGSNGDGHEIESFGSLAEDRGAQSIIASLWPVADSSTPLLMEWFYSQLSHSGISKAEALRQAQLSLLHGTVFASGTNTQRAWIVPDTKDKSTIDAPPFTPDPKAPFAHPYYWAPFILIGNWK